MDLTLLVATRAMDTALSSYLSKVVPQGVANFGDPLLFIASCTCIMFCWFFYPEKLPPSYHKWITSAANMDIEFWEVLRLVRQKKLIYGQHGPYEDFWVLILKNTVEILEEETPLSHSQLNVKRFMHSRQRVVNSMHYGGFGEGSNLPLEYMHL